MTYSPDGLGLEVERRDSEVIIKLAGEIDLSNIARVRAALDDAASRAEPRVIVDLSQVSFLDSSTLGELVQARQRLADVGQALVLTGLTPRVTRLFELTGLTGHFDIESQA